MSMTISIPLPNEPSPSYVYNLLEDVHLYPEEPTTNGQTWLTVGKFKYFHYKCDGLNDVGWGCAYRTLQSLSSLILTNKISRSVSNVVVEPPSILDIQKTLISLNDKPPKFLNSREWIGAVEVAYVLDTLYDVPCKIVHVSKGSELIKHVDTIKSYFEKFGGLIMMGGDQDAASKGIAGLHISCSDTYLLVVDPHYSGSSATVQQLAGLGFVRWENINSFVQGSFYNLCLPQANVKSV